MAKVALLVGVGNYDRSEDLKPLASAPKDVVAMQRILQNPDMGGFSEVIPLIDPDQTQLQGAVEALYRDRTREDLVLLFFSGHGIKDEQGNLYFASRMTEKTPRGELIRSSAVPASFVREIMANCRSRRQIVILDCCFSGAFDPAFQSKDDRSVDLQTQLGAEGRVVLASSSSTQYSFEQPGAELSIYTRYLVEGIETGAADLDNDGEVAVRELHEYATRKVREAAPNMNPKIIVLKDKGYEIIVAKAQVTDPKLKYRKSAERYSVRGTISPAGRSILDTLRDRLKLSQAETDEIENQVLQPFRQRLKNLQNYQEALSAELEQEYPLSAETVQTLKDLQDILGLRQEDVAPIKQKAFERYAQQPAPPSTLVEPIKAAPPEPAASQNKPNPLEHLRQSIGNLNPPEPAPAKAAEARQPSASRSSQSLVSELPQPQNTLPQARSGQRNIRQRNTRSLVLTGLLVSGALGAILIGGSILSSQHPKSSPTPGESVSASQPSSRGLYTQALDKQNKGDNSGAIADYTQAIQLDKNWGVDNPTNKYYGSASAYYCRGIARADSGNKQGAIADYDQAIKLKPDFAEAYGNRGNVRAGLGDMQGAIADYDEALRLKNPEPWIDYNGRGNARADSGDKQGAIADYDQAIKLKPDFAEAYYRRGNARADSGDKQGAIADYDQAIKLKPGYAEAYKAQGNAYYNLSKDQDAIADYDRAIALKAGYADAYYDRGLSRNRLKNLQGAKQDFQKAADLYQQRGNAEWHQKALDRLKELQ
jgi:tetratricopeptide (TPR) repeat protein